MIRRILPLVAFSASLGACSDPELEMRVAQLETEVAQLKGGAPAAAAPAAHAATAKPGAPPAAAAAPTDERKEAGIALFREANALVAANKYAEAKAKLNELATNYGDTPAAKSGQKVMAEIEVIGKDAGPLAVETWYQGKTQIDPNQATVMVFWEVWCPHCKREVPKLEEMHKTWAGKGVQVIGLTKQTRDITDDQVRAFIKEKGVTYPMAKEAGGAMSSLYNVSGIPAAAVVKGGKVVWRGHPARITDEMLKEWTGS